MRLTPAARRFIRYSIIGFGTFLLDLAMLYAAVSWLHIPYYIATPCAFLIAVSINYVLSRKHVFRGTERSLHGGYAYFALVAIFAAVITTALVALVVSWLGVYYLLARILVAAIIGIGNYLFNLHINFSVAGKH